MRINEISRKPENAEKMELKSTTHGEISTTIKILDPRTNESDLSNVKGKINNNLATAAEEEESDEFDDQEYHDNDKPQNREQSLQMESKNNEKKSSENIRISNQKRTFTETELSQSLGNISVYF